MTIIGRIREWKERLELAEIELFGAMKENPFFPWYANTYLGATADQLRDFITQGLDADWRDL